MRTLPKLLCAASLVLAAAQAQEPTFRVDVNLVRILATVKDASGRLVGTLGKEDFNVLDNGALQQIAVFERRTEQPLLVSLLIDNSGSTAKDLKYEVESVNRFVRALFAEGNPKDAKCTAVCAIDAQIPAPIAQTRSWHVALRCHLSRRPRARKSRRPQGDRSHYRRWRHNQLHGFPRRAQGRPHGRRGDLFRPGDADHQ